jgi:hypothetical protein
VGTGETSKSPFAQINGTLQSVDPAALQAQMEAALSDPAWTQVGYDPRRHTFFYDRSTQQPILSADEVIQVGPLVMAKNAVTGDGQSFLFQDSAPVAHPESLDALTSLEDTFAYAGEKTYGSNREFKVDIQERLRAATAELGIDPADGSPESIAYLTRVGVKDAIYALRDNANAVGWYDEKVTTALNLLSLIHPELATDAEARLRFTWALAATSNGLKVDKNFELAEQVYTASKKTGRFTTKVQAGTAQKAINDGLQMYNDLLDQFGPDDLQKFSTSFFPAALITKITGVPVKGEEATTLVRGAAVLGPKIGNGFFSNLYGYFDALTMDRWLMRTWGRWTGTLIYINEELLAEKTKASIANLNILLADDDMVARIEEIATRREKEPKQRYKKDGTPIPIKPPVQKTIPAREVTEANVMEVAEWLNRNIYMKKAKREEFNALDLTIPEWGVLKGKDSKGKEITFPTEVRLVTNAMLNYADGQAEMPGSGYPRQVRAQGTDIDKISV